jgi:phosphatidylserine/phosphatidylglycerophosphate/cardiolipin synthase-like enzyme
MDKDWIHRSDKGESSLLKMMKIMSHATQVDICVMNLANWQLADFLMCLKRTLRTKIRIIADDGKEFKKGTKLPKLIDEGFEVRIPGSSQENATDKYRAIMHHKFAVINNEAALIGSLNWTEHGILKNRESVLVSRSKLVASTLSEEFESLWQQCRIAKAEDFKLDAALASSK